MTAGRPRDADVDRAIRDAAIEVIIDGGVATATIQAIARRAGVPRSTVYRRYRSVYDVIAALGRETADAQPVPDTGDLRADLLTALRVSVAGLSQPRQLRLTAELVAAGTADAGVGEVVRELWTIRRAATTALVERAVERGELPAGTDPDLLLDLISGQAYMRLLVRGAEIIPELLEEAVDIVLRGAGHISLHIDAK